MSFIGTLGFAVYLDEWSLGGSEFEKACLAKGVKLPLTEPRIEVSVSAKTLSVFDGDVLIRRYDVGTGKERRLHLLRKGTNSTPQGEYRIVEKLVRTDVLRRGSRFMRIDYPSYDDVNTAFERGLIDREVFNRCLAALRLGEPLPDDLPFGDTIGIQGNHTVFGGSHSTDGGIALQNGDINDLFEFIPEGTPVVIDR